MTVAGTLNQKVYAYANLCEQGKLTNLFPSFFLQISLGVKDKFCVELS